MLRLCFAMEKNFVFANIWYRKYHQPVAIHFSTKIWLKESIKSGHEYLFNSQTFYWNDVDIRPIDNSFSLHTNWFDWWQGATERCSVKKGVLKNLAKFTGKELYQSLFINPHMHKTFSELYCMKRVPGDPQKEMLN